MDYFTSSLWFCAAIQQFISTVCSKRSINMTVFMGILGVLKPLSLLYANHHNLSINSEIAKILRSLASCSFSCPYCSISATDWPTASRRAISNCGNKRL